MDTHERIANLKASLPKGQQETFDALLSRCATLEELTPHPIKKAEQNHGTAKLPSFPPPPPFPEHFLRELDCAPVVTHLQIRQEAEREIAVWVAGGCQYLGSFLELNNDDPTVTFAQSYMNFLDIEACIRLLYLDAVLSDNPRSNKYFTRFFPAAVQAFSVQDGQAELRSAEDFTIRTDSWKKRVIQELETLYVHHHQCAAPAGSPSSTPEKTTKEDPPKKGCLPLFLLLLAGCLFASLMLIQ